MLDELDRKSSLGLPWRVEEAYAAAAGAGAAGRREPATKRLTPARLLPQFVLRIAGIGPIESRSASHAGRAQQVPGPY